MKLTVAIPTHDMDSKDYFFRRCLDSLWNQSFQDFEIVVTDNSEDDRIEEICDWYRTGIRYFRNPNKGMAPNTNEAIMQSEGQIIKILYMDDYMAHDEALEMIVKRFRGEWLVSGCTHTINGEDFFKPHLPHYSTDIVMGKNTIGSPSVMAIRNSDTPMLFDEQMTWLLDCDYYKRMYDAFGEPVILKDINVVMGIHDGQMTNRMGDARKLQEHQYISTKYG